VAQKKRNKQTKKHTKEIANARLNPQLQILVVYHVPPELGRVLVDKNKLLEDSLAGTQANRYWRQPGSWHDHKPASPCRPIMVPKHSHRHLTCQLDLTER
ncbi:MAG: hypothetical protein MUC44_11095, partial [Beijerinckiaceae bacterium]|nr:hypothetical protein [Beijerinckiaceae bacterium]